MPDWRGNYDRCRRNQDALQVPKNTREATRRLRTAALIREIARNSELFDGADVYFDFSPPAI